MQVLLDQQIQILKSVLFIYYKKIRVIIKKLEIPF